MSKNKLNAKITAIIGAALASINNAEGKDLNMSPILVDDSKTESFDTFSKKPMPVLKLDINNPENHKFIASHVSHASHRSHSSHRSHFSHRSGGMFA